ncbi:unnamed protein product [Mytilus coruscus]|uniref:Peptidase aspartic putative domain-containing protein n=1 Tax=Mytilus coruscus TaxID=42192 RepID=A0A6J8C025_MYTCO|nr:unnamed protein product [Mytilus coruscus]
MYGYDLCRENNQNKTDNRVFTSKHHNIDTVKSKVTMLSTQSLNNTAKYEHKCNCCTGTCVDLTSCSKFKSMSLDDRKGLSVKKLPISARSAAENVDIRKLPYLADIQIPSTDLTEVMLLIGTDSPNAHIPLEVRSGNENQPCAIRSRLGWAIRGPIEDTHASNVINVHFEEARDVLLQRQLERMWTSDFDDRAREDKNGLSIEDRGYENDGIIYNAGRWPLQARTTLAR